MNRERTRIHRMRVLSALLEDCCPEGGDAPEELKLVMLMDVDVAAAEYPLPGKGQRCGPLDEGLHLRSAPTRGCPMNSLPPAS